MSFKNFSSEGLLTDSQSESGNVHFEYLVGGTGVVGHQVLLEATAATQEGQVIDSLGFNYFGDGPTATYSQITIGDVGQEWNDDNAYKFFAAGGQANTTPTVSDSQMSIVQPSASGSTLVHTNKVQALANPDPTRTTIGVGEEVDFSGMPANTTWREGNTIIIPTPTGPTYAFFAPSSAGSAKVTASAPNQASKSVTFKVLEPTGVDHTVIVATDNLGPPVPPPGSFPPGTAGAEMQIKVYMAPTSVSFYNVEIEEIGEDATDIQGYFTNANFTPEMLHHFPGGWFYLGADNSWVDNCWTPGEPDLPWSSGSFTWNVPWDWGVSGGGVVVSTSGENPWQQVFSIDSAGTAKITKFGSAWVQRTTNNVITHD